MTQEEARMDVQINADTRPFAAALKELEGLSDDFGKSLGGALSNAASEGFRLDSILRGLAGSLAGKALDFGLKPLQDLGGTFFGKAFGALAGAMPFANGGVFSGGGVVSQPALFPMRGGTGLMGEAGPEAIMPLKRGPDGRLGVASAGGGRAVNVTVNVTTPDVAGFQRSQSQIAAQLGRVLSRGDRNA